MKPISFGEYATTGFPLHFPFTLGNPLSAYRPLLERLAEDHRVLPIYIRPLWSSTSIDYLRHWRLLPDVLSRFRNDQKLHWLIYAGHSIYATKTLCLALRQHDHFHTLVRIYLVIFLPWIIRLWILIFDLHLSCHLYPLVKNILWRRDVFKHAFS